jgi:two-component system, chemotaxis family, sensor kinase CheA
MSDLELEMQAALATFVLESRELLEQLEGGLLALEEQADDESVNALFRAAHTIKGSSGLFGLDHVVRFTHVLESVLHRLRTGELAVTAGLVGALLPFVDHLGAMLAQVADGRLVPDDATQATADALVAAVAPYLLPTQHSPASPEASEAPAPADAGPRRVHLSVQFGADCLRSGMDPLAFVRYLSTLGDVTSVSTLTGLLPDADAFDPQSSYLVFEIDMATDAPVAELEAVFDFVREESRIRVLGPQASAADLAECVTSAGPLAAHVRGALVEGGFVAAARLDAALGGEEPASGTPPVQATMVATAADPEADAEAGRRVRVGAGTGSAAPRLLVTPDARSIRVDAGRLDRLIDAVGELVIAGASAELSAAQRHDDEMIQSLGELMRLVEEVRNSALQLRMVPIGTTFSRFQRVVRDVSADLGKDIGLVISGGETEVDKALVEQIGDPLTHLVRNAVDHGIESAEVRAARGKPARATIQLNAFHDSGSIVIEVSDDGGGLDSEKVLARAVQRGLVEPGATLSDAEINALIFEPGFSTKETVSDLSGRGVGMDVVKRNVTALRGTIDVENRPGQGCTVRIRLPLTLAIIDSFMVAVGGVTYMVPLDWVDECVELPAEVRTRTCMNLRGEVLPFVRLRSVFGVDGEVPRRENVVVVQCGGIRVGLVVDTLLGEFQTVIKPLGRLFEQVYGIGGSTILGNGDVALIIDVPVLVRHYAERSVAREVAASRVAG